MLKRKKSCLGNKGSGGSVRMCFRCLTRHRAEEPCTRHDAANTPCLCGWMPQVLDDGTLTCDCPRYKGTSLSAEEWIKQNTEREDDKIMDTDIKKKYEDALKQFWEQLTPMVAGLSKVRNEMATKAREQADKLRRFGSGEKAAKLEGMADAYEETAENLKKLLDDEELRGLFIEGPPWFRTGLDILVAAAEDINAFIERDKKKTEALNSIATSLALLQQQQLKQR